eukprot:2244772-Prymnesium_polylepis.1
MSGEIHEAPIVHSNISCSSLHLSSLEVLSSSPCYQESSIPEWWINTFNDVGVSLGGVETSSGLGIQVPAGGLYSSSFTFESSSNVTENVLELGSGQYLEMTNPAGFQANGSFSIDMEWKGTNFDTDVPDGMAGSRVALVSTGTSGNYFGVFATKYDTQNYSLIAECSDGSE